MTRLANILEDGVGLDWAFFAFVLGLLILDLAMLALTIAVGVLGRGRRRFLAVIPAGTLTGIQLFVIAGGPINLATWLAAAAAALVVPARAPEPLTAVIS